MHRVVYDYAYSRAECVCARYWRTITVYGYRPFSLNQFGPPTGANLHGASFQIFTFTNFKGGKSRWRIAWSDFIAPRFDHFFIFHCLNKFKFIAGSD